MDNILINDYLDYNKNFWEVRIVDNGTERLLARCKEQRDCYREMTIFLKSQGINCERIFYHTHPCDGYIHITSTGDYVFHLYEIKKEN